MFEIAARAVWSLITRHVGFVSRIFIGLAALLFVIANFARQTIVWEMYRVNILGFPIDVMNLSWLTLASMFLFSAFFVARDNKGYPFWDLALATVAIVVLETLTTVLHEAGHAIVALTTGYPVWSAGITDGGAYVNVGFDAISPTIALVTLAGPLVNFVCGGLALRYARQCPEGLTRIIFHAVGMINIITGLINAFPFDSSDGAKAFYVLLQPLLGDTDIRLIVSYAIYFVIVFGVRAFNRQRKMRSAPVQVAAAS